MQAAKARASSEKERYRRTRLVRPSMYTLRAVAVSYAPEEWCFLHSALRIAGCGYRE